MTMEAPTGVMERDVSLPRLPTEVWAIVATFVDQNDVFSFASASRQLREAQRIARRDLVTSPAPRLTRPAFFSEAWCAYWSARLDPNVTKKRILKAVVDVAVHHGYCGVLRQHWSVGPRKKLRLLWDQNSCGVAARFGHLGVLRWLRSQGCQWDERTCHFAATAGQLEILEWARSQNPPCPWVKRNCVYEASNNDHHHVLAWIREQPDWD